MTTDTKNTEPVLAEVESFDLTESIEIPGARAAEQSKVFVRDCSRDAVLMAWATMRVAQQLNNLADAVDAVYQKHDGIERSLDNANDIAERG